MKIAPLIYSRTFYADFNLNFIVRPDDLDVVWARDKIFPSLRDLDLLHGFRRIVAKKDDLCIAGISGYFRDLIQKYLPEVAAEANQYFFDENRRGIIIFIGYAFKGMGVPDVKFEDLWQMFSENMQQIWNSENPNNVYVHYIQWKTKNPSAEKPPGSQRIGDVECYEINEDTEEQIFEWCLAQRIDFCSNVNRCKVFQNTNYKVITASQSVIDRIKADPPQIPQESTEILNESPSLILPLNQQQNISVEDFLKLIKTIQPQDISVEDFLKVLKEFANQFVIVEVRNKIRNEHEVDCAEAGYTFLGNYEITMKFRTNTPMNKGK